MIKVFIGFDEVETIAFHVLSNSIHRQASMPVSITPVMLGQLRDIFDRERDPLQSNEFSFSRWLVPYLCGYKGWAIFMDCDMLVMEDIAFLWALRDPNYAVQVVKHNHQPIETVKYLGNSQTRYSRKNWSSVMLFNCSRCRELTPEYIERANGLDLHQFTWTDDDKIGSLPASWNHLVGYDEPKEKVNNAHFTIGGPYFNEYRDCEFSSEWNDEYLLLHRCD